MSDNQVIDEAVDQAAKFLQSKGDRRGYEAICNELRTEPRFTRAMAEWRVDVRRHRRYHHTIAPGEAPTSSEAQQE